MNTVDNLTLTGNILVVAAFVALLLNRSTKPNVRTFWNVVIYTSMAIGIIMHLLSIAGFGG